MYTCPPNHIHSCFSIWETITFKVDEKVFHMPKGDSRGLDDRKTLFWGDMDCGTSYSCSLMSKVHAYKIPYLQELWNIEKKNFPQRGMLKFTYILEEVWGGNKGSFNSSLD